MPPARPPLTVQETMQALAVSDSTVRRMLKAGQLVESGRDDAGRILIDPQSVDAAAVGLGRAELAGAEVRREIVPRLDTLATEFGALLATIERQQETIQDLARQLGEAQAEARLLPARAELAEQRATLLQQELEGTRRALDAAQAEIERLRAQPPAYAPDQAPRQPEYSLLQRGLRRLLKR